MENELFCWHTTYIHTNATAFDSKGNVMIKK